MACSSTSTNELIIFEIGFNTFALLSPMYEIEDLLSDYPEGDRGVRLLILLLLLLVLSTSEIIRL